jgi:hypothetical protein
MLSKGSEGAFTGDSAPSEARKRGSGGGSPRKHDDLLTGRSDQDAQSIIYYTPPFRQSLSKSYRTSWGILPQTPVFSLRSARCHWYSSITLFTEPPVPKDLLGSRDASGGWAYEGPSEASHGDSGSSETRNRGTGGGFPRKYDDSVTNRSGDYSFCNR